MLNWNAVGLVLNNPVNFVQNHQKKKKKHCTQVCNLSIKMKRQSLQTKNVNNAFSLHPSISSLFR